MARIPLTSGFTVIPEGTYTFKVTNVEYDEDFGIMKLGFKTTTGKKHSERYSLLNAQGEPNDGACAAFSILAKACLNDDDREEIDEQELMGCMFDADIEHSEVESKKTPGRMNTYAHLKNIKAHVEEGGFDLNDILG